jgi:sugar phosphate isomerase/epimerase
LDSRRAEQTYRFKKKGRPLNFKFNDRPNMMEDSTDFQSMGFSPGRRDFIHKAGMAVLALSSPLPDFSEYFEKEAMGIVVHSYWSRWNSNVQSERFPAFQDAKQLMLHCYEIGAGGIQVGVGAWSDSFAYEIKSLKEKRGMFLEGSISLPQNDQDSERFENEVKIAKSAGVEVFRTVCLSGRRYEDFKSIEEFEDFKKSSIAALERASKIVAKYQVKLGVENHKDWKAEELVDLIKKLDNDYVGVTIDFGNNLALMEDPNEVIELLAPYAFSTHIKDMGIKEYENGFLLSEVPLGEGIVYLKKAVETCKKYNPDIKFSLEMITRDPLEIPCLTKEYWATFPDAPASVMLEILKLVKEKEFEGALPKVSHLTGEQKLELEEKNILKCLAYSKNTLGIGA